MILSDADSRVRKPDVIRDVFAGEDLIDLSAIDAAPGGGDDAFAWIGAAGFTGAAGELRFAPSQIGGLLEGDADGDGRADFRIALRGVAALSVDDLML